MGVGASAVALVPGPMRSSLSLTYDLLRASPPARRFFAAYAQSSLGTGISLVALPLLALTRYGSSWAVAAVLLADLVPAMLFGGRLGALADRLPRRTCVVGADALRCAALLGIVAVHSLPATFVLAALVGVGTAVYQPAALTGLSELGDEQAATSLFGTISSTSRTAGALVAGAVFAFVGPAGAILVDAGTFACSALLLAGVALGRPERAAKPDAAGARPPGVTPIAAAAAATFLAAGLSNVAEPIYVTRGLGAGATGFALMFAAWGLGAAAGSMLATRSRDAAVIRRRMGVGIALFGAGFVVAALSPALVPALIGFAVNGLGNGMATLHERLLVRAVVAPDDRGRAFGIVESAASWAFGAALVAAGALVALAGARATILCAGVATLAVGAAVLSLSPTRAKGVPMPAHRG